MGDTPPVPTELVAGKYKLTRMLGRGGMGSVWEGIHITLGTRVACKFIEAEYSDSGEALARFENEARAAAALRSKHVVKVFDHGVSESGQPYIVMEFLSGEPLDARLDRVGRLSIGETAVIIQQVSRALAKAHEVGIVHRDLKPENVFLVWDDEDQADVAKVVDFGIAKFTDASAGISSATRTGSVLGTPYYMSPEQARGLRSVDERSDLWSVGVIAFRCVVGRLPFDGEAIGDLLVKLCTAPIPVPSHFDPALPPSFDAWVARALSRDPAERFQDARTLSDELNRVAGSPTRGQVPSSVEGVGFAAGGATPYSPASAGPHTTTGQHAAGTGRHSSTTPFPAGTPFPGTGGHRTSFPAGGVSGGAGITNVALTHTPPPHAAGSRRSMWAAVVAGVVVLGIGGAVLAKVLGGPDETSTSVPPTDVTTPSTNDQAVAAPVVAPAAPTPDVAPADPPADEDEEPEAEEEAEAPKPTPKPAFRPRPASVRVQPPPAPEPVAATPPPAPKPTPPPPPRVKPRPKPKPRPGSNIDVGY